MYLYILFFCLFVFYSGMSQLKHPSSSEGKTVVLFDLFSQLIYLEVSSCWSTIQSTNKCL